MVAVERPREAGAVILGKTNVPEFGYSGVGHNPAFETMTNPWGTSLTPGGSSAGSGAAVASGMGPIALGSDGGGSVRIPSSFCEFDVPPGNDWCGQDDPDRSDLTMGISVGYGDNYRAFLDGQSIEVTDIPEGSYYLVHRVNAEVRESDYSNNAASVLLELRWPNGSDSPPTITTLASCADTARCSPGQPRSPAPPDPSAT